MIAGGWENCLYGLRRRERCAACGRAGPLRAPRESRLHYAARWLVELVRR